MTTPKNCITKFCQCEPFTLIYHLYTEYGTIISSNLTSNFYQMTARSNPPATIFDLFQQLNYGKYFADEVNEIINSSQLLPLFYYNAHAYWIFNKMLKTRRKKINIDKIYANFVPFVTQQEKYRISSQPTSGTVGFSNSVIGRIVNNKMQESINQMGPLYQYPYE